MGRFLKIFQLLNKIDPFVKNFLTYHPTLNSAIDRSRRALQLCRGGRGEWVGFHLYFWSIFKKRILFKKYPFLNFEISKFAFALFISKGQTQFWPCSTSPTTPLWIAQSTDLGELYKFVVGVEVSGWSLTYTFCRFLKIFPETRYTLYLVSGGKFSCVL